VIRWLVSLICICFLWFYGFNFPAIAAPGGDRAFTEQQIQQGERIANKALRAAQKGDLVRSEAYWTELIEKFPENPAVWSNRGNVRIGQYRLAEAIADFDRSIELAPNYPDSYLNRGIAYEGQQLWSQAVADYNRVLEIDPQDPVAYNNRGNAEAGQQLWQEALKDYQQAISIAPDFAMARGNAALVTYQLGDRSEALRQMRNLVRKYPMFSDMRAALAAVLWVDGQQGEAESNWVAAVGLDNRYQNINWVQNIRRWPPTMVEALNKFLTLN
jgi:tetratricopeptide (TPR) repeat protein